MYMASLTGADAANAVVRKMKKVRKTTAALVTTLAEVRHALLTDRLPMLLSHCPVNGMFRTLHASRKVRAFCHRSTQVGVFAFKVADKRHLQQQLLLFLL